MKKSSGTVIKALRLHHGYKQAFVANKLFVDVSVLANLENGRVCLSIERLIKFGEIYATNPCYILALIIDFKQNGNEVLLKENIKTMIDKNCILNNIAHQNY